MGEEIAQPQGGRGIWSGISCAPSICVVSQVNREKMPALVCPRFPHFLRMAPWPESSDGKGLSLFPVLPKKTPLVIKERQDTTINLLCAEPLCLQHRAWVLKDSGHQLL